MYPVSERPFGIPGAPDPLTLISLSRGERIGALNPLDNVLRNIYSSSYQGIDTDGVKGTRIDICRM